MILIIKLLTSWITSSYLSVCWEKIDGMLHPSPITISSESRNLRVISSTSHIFWFWYECSAAVLILIVHYVDINWFLPLSTFSFHFDQIPLLIHLISLSFDLFELKSLSLPLSSISFWSFCFLHFFSFCKCCLSCYFRNFYFFQST